MIRVKHTIRSVASRIHPRRVDNQLSARSSSTLKILKGLKFCSKPDLISLQAAPFHSVAIDGYPSIVTTEIASLKKEKNWSKEIRLK